MYKKSGSGSAIIATMLFLYFVIAMSAWVYGAENAAAGASASGERAATVRLSWTEGSVNVYGSSGKGGVTVTAGMRLANGNRVVTEQRSYAWLGLDENRALKEDALSEVEIRKNGKNLEVLLSSGSLFFDVAKPLESDETMNIRTSTMVMGIRGTIGCMKVIDGTVTQAYILEGSTECIVEDSVTGEIQEYPSKCRRYS